MQTPAMQCDPSPQTSIRASPTFSNVEISIPDRDWSQNIESRYAEIHQSIDSAFTVLAFFMQSSLHVHKVRQQNRTVFDKLIAFEKSLENGTLYASLRPTAVDLLEGDTNGLVKTPFSTVDEGLQLQDHPNADCIALKDLCSGTGSSSFEGFEPSRKLPRVADPRSSARTIQCKQTDKEGLARTSLVAKQHYQSGAASNFDTKRNQKNSQRLTSKFASIASEDAVERVAEFAAQSRDLDVLKSMNVGPEQKGEFLNTTQIADGTDFLRMLPGLAMAIECNNHQEIKYRVHKRIALAHFYHAYTLAQENPSTFLSWSDKQSFSERSVIAKGGNKSIVLQRFADMVFPASSSTNQAGYPPKRGNRAARLQAWRKMGKPWAMLIKKFGYGILLLVPHSLTDEDLRIAQDWELESNVRAMEARRAEFAPLLQKANRLVVARVTQCVEDDGRQCRIREVDWTSFLHPEYI